MRRGTDPFIEEITDSKEVMHARVPAAAQWFLTLLLVLLLVAFCFMFFMQRDISVSAQGIIESNRPVETVVSVSGGKILSCNIEDGSTVHDGDVLVVIDTDYAEQQLSLYEGRLSSLEADIESQQLLKQSYEQGTNLLNPNDTFYSVYQTYALECDIINENSRLDSTSSNNTSSAISGLRALYQRNIDQGGVRMAELERLYLAISNMQSFDSTDAYVQSIYLSFITDYEYKQALLEEATDNYNQATEDYLNGTVSEDDVDIARNHMDASRNNLSLVLSSYGEQIQSNIASEQAQVSSYETQLSQLQLQEGQIDKSSLHMLSIDQLTSQRIAQVEDSISSAEKEIETYKMHIIDLNSQIENGVVVSNSAGTVMFEQTLIPGEVVQAGSTLLKIVPTDEEYKAILLVQDKDIASVKVGGSASLSISAFPYQEHGRILGTITYISATSVPVEGAGYFYRVEVSLSGKELGDGGSLRETIAAGMTVSANIVSGTESWLDWLLKEINFSD